MSLEITEAAVMLSFEWNSLRSGDAVIVHDDLDPGLALAEGVVTLVEPQPWDTNDGAIRIDEPRPEVLGPRRHVVHLLPLDRRTCWRCDANAHADLHSAAA